MATRSSPEPTYTDLARVGARLERTVDAKTCARLQAAAAEVYSIRASLEFSFDDMGRAAVSGTAEAEIALDCQLCSEPVRLTIHAAVDGVLASSEGEAQDWRTADDPPHIIVVQQAELDVEELIEDELLLMLPQRVCTDVSCPRRPVMAYGEAGANSDNPFRQLAALKNALSEPEQES